MSRRSQASCAAVLAAAIAALGCCSAAAQRAGASAREMAPIDITGHWVSLITDDWVYRMLTPARGDYSFVPLNEAGRQEADRWDPTRDAAAGEHCKAYGAPAIMRLPSRVEISWEDDDTLRLDVDTGMQTRLFHFAADPSPGPRSRQGYSHAAWEFSGDLGRQLVFGGARTSLERVGVTGSLAVETDNLLPGYLRRNGVPFSQDAFMTEYYSLIAEDDGNEYLIIQTFVDDPTYLREHFVRTMQFKRERNGARRAPMDCETATALSYGAGGVPRLDGAGR
jgi:hypothetical protein